MAGRRKDLTSPEPYCGCHRGYIVDGSHDCSWFQSVNFTDICGCNVRASRMR